MPMSIKKIPIGIVGLNYGRWIIEALLDAKGAGQFFEIAAVCDLDPSRAQEMSKKADAPIATLDELLANPAIPALGLFTGPAGRAQLIRKIMAAGKDIMTTKPFELDACEATKVFEEAKAQGRVLHLNSPAPLLPPDLAQIQQWRDQYSLGRAIGCRAETYSPYQEQADGSWYDDPERCPVAPVFRIGIYLINDLVHLFGKPEAVQVLSSRIRTGRPTADNAQVGILFSNGTLANVFASLCIDDGQRWSDSMTLNFEHGTIYRNVGPLVFGGGPEGTTTLRLLTRRDNHPYSEQVRFENRSGHYQWEAFYRAIHGEKLEPPVGELATALRVIAAIARAEKSGTREDL